MAAGADPSGRDSHGRDPDGREQGGNGPQDGEPAGGDGFELEPERDRPEPPPPRPLPEAPVSEPVEGAPGAPASEEPEVDPRTVAERRGESRPRGAREKLPPPPGWPGEAFGFPFRAPGRTLVFLGVVTLVALDLLGLLEAFRFPGWMLKLMLLVYVLRAQFHVIGTSAAGHDGPRGWRRALTFDREDFRQYWRTLLFFAGALAPGTLLWVFDQVSATVILLLLLGSMYAAVVALGAALQDPRLKWPWHALRWLGMRPLHCIVGSFGWWVLLGTEIALYQLVDEAPILYGFVAAILRLACMYVLLLSARALGVMGRSWTG